jgi:hypothetical protein
MKLVHSRIALLAALALLAVTPAVSAQKRRAVHTPTPVGAAFTANVKGTVVDAVTGAPIAFASVSIGNSRTVASTDGNFQMSNVTGFGSSAVVSASRSGYNTQTLPVPGPGTHTLSFRLQGRPTVTVRNTNGTISQIDDDSVKFGYVVVFGGQIASEEEDFCTLEGTAMRIGASQIKRITGPATLVTNAACCSRAGSQSQQVHVELRNGQTHDLIFKDSCDGYLIDLIGKEHVSGTTLFVKFSDVAEVIFP